MYKIIILSVMFIFPFVTDVTAGGRSPWDPRQNGGEGHEDTQGGKDLNLPSHKVDDNDEEDTNPNADQTPERVT